MMQMRWDGDWKNLFILTCVAWIAMLPALISPYLQAHDFAYHVIFSHHFTSQLFMGEFYPRWLYAMNDGFGSPAFFYYAPLPYYFTACLTWVFHLQSASPYPTIVCASIALWLSGVTGYYWVVRFTTRSAALLLSILYLILPYHLIVDGYVRFSFAEFWSFVWMPLILSLSYDVCRQQFHRVISLTLSITALLLTHLPTSILFLPLLVCMPWVFAKREQRIKVVFWHGIAGLLAVGLSAIYWLPAQALQPYVSMYSMFQGMFFYRNNFLISGPVYGHSILFWRFLTFLTVFVMALVAAAGFLSRYRPRLFMTRGYYFWMFVAVASFCMTLPVSSWLWAWIKPIQYIQFPWRFNTLLSVSFITVLAMTRGKTLTSPFMKKGQRVVRFINFLMASLLIGSLIYGMQFIFFKRYVAQDFTDRLAISRSPLEYRPHWTPEEKFIRDEIIHFSKDTPVIISSENNTRWTIHHWSPRSLAFDADVPDASEITLHQFYFPGWVGVTTATKEPLLLSPSSDGLISFVLPAGHQSVQLTLALLPEEKIGGWISGISFSLMIIVAMWFLWRRRLKRRYG